MVRSQRNVALFLSTALGMALACQQAAAQSPTAAAVANNAGNSSQQATGIEEVVVTATRQTSSVNRVAMSVAAVTQRTLDR